MRERRKEGIMEENIKRGLSAATLTQFYFFRCIRPCAENDAIKVVTARGGDVRIRIRKIRSLSCVYRRKEKDGSKWGGTIIVEAEEESRRTDRIVRTFIVAAVVDLSLWCAR